MFAENGLCEFASDNGFKGDERWLPCRGYVSTKIGLRSRENPRKISSIDCPTGALAKIAWG